MNLWPPLGVDTEALTAGVDLVGRTGATELEIGYLHHGVPVEDAAWWAQARYKGARLTVEDHRDPVAAVEALAVRLLTGAQCQHCHRLVCLDDAGAMAHDSTLLDGRKWSTEEQAAAGLCNWRRVGPKWIRGCETTPAAPAGGPNRAERRRTARGAR